MFTARYGLKLIKVMFNPRYGLCIQALCVHCAVLKQLKLTAVCKVSSAQIYGSDIIFGNSLLFTTSHNDSRQSVCLL